MRTTRIVVAIVSVLLIVISIYTAATSQDVTFGRDSVMEGCVIFGVVGALGLLFVLLTGIMKSRPRP